MCTAHLCESHVEDMHFVAHILWKCPAPELVLSEDGPQANPVGETGDHLLRSEEKGMGQGRDSKHVHAHPKAF